MSHPARESLMALLPIVRHLLAKSGIGRMVTTRAPAILEVMLAPPASRAVAPWVAVIVPEARVIGLQQTAQGELASGSCRQIDREMKEASALLVGPGMFDGRAAGQLLRTCLTTAHGPVLIIDAGALPVLKEAVLRLNRRRKAMILTPHAGEMAQLADLSREQVTADPVGVARRATAQLGAIVALKGARTYMAGPDGRVFHNTAGNAGLGTSGSGDTLSGVIAGLCARGAERCRPRCGACSFTPKRETFSPGAPDRWAFWRANCSPNSPLSSHA